MQGWFGVRTEEFRKHMSKVKKNISLETRKRMSEAKKGFIPWNKGMKCPQISEALRGKSSGMLGKHCSEEHKRKIAESQMGEKCNHWKGGKKVYKAKEQAKRRQLGFNLWNMSFMDAEAHHLNKEDVIFIPREIHQRIKHNLYMGKNMDIINDLAIKYLEVTLQ